MVYWVAGIVVLLVCLVVFVLYKIKPEGEAEVLKRLAKKDISISFEMIEGNEGAIRVARAVNEDGKKLILIHGSPGDWSAWSNIFLNEEIRRKFDIVAFDRPGYGKTSISAQGALKNQAEAVRQIRSALWPTEEYIVVGHSYGGAVVAKLLLDQNEPISGAVLVAATLCPKLQAPKWYNKLGESRMMNWLLSSDFKSSNTEMLSLQKELQANETHLSSLNRKVILIQGKKDILVPYETVAYLKKHVTGFEYVIKDRMNHFVPWSNPELITKAILSFDMQE